MKASVIFKYSQLYDKILRKVHYGRKRTSILKPSEIPNYIEDVRRLWGNNGERIMAELVKITTLKWEEDTIYCYIVGDSIPFPDPLTVPAYRGMPDYFVDILIHELIERLFLQSVNGAKMQLVWNYFEENYRKELRITKNHIPVHAIYTHIMLKFFNEDRLNRERMWISYLPAYKRSWDIVYKKGYKEIIQKFREIVK